MEALKHDIEPVILESPYAGDVDLNLYYARKCARYLLVSGYAPFASHMLYTQPHILDDNIKDERRLGIVAGQAFYDRVKYVYAFTDLGISEGMKESINLGIRMGKQIRMTKLPDWQEDFKRYRDGNV